MAKTDGRFRRVWWPTLNDTQSAKKAVQQGAWYAVFTGVATALIATLNVEGVTHNFLDMDAWSFVDASIILVLAILMFRLSRVASILALALYAAGRVIEIQSGQAQGQGIVFILFGLFYVNAVRGAFAYWRLSSLSISPSQAATVK